MEDDGQFEPAGGRLERLLEGLDPVLPEVVGFFELIVDRELALHRRTTQCCN